MRDNGAFYPTNPDDFINYLMMNDTDPKYSVADIRVDSQTSLISGYKKVDEILSCSYGRIYYQEQAMNILHRIGGLTLEQAERFRKMLARMDKSKMTEYRSVFLNKAKEQGIKEDYAINLFNKIISIIPYTRLRAYYIAKAKMHTNLNQPNIDNNVHIIGH